MTSLIKSSYKVAKSYIIDEKSQKNISWTSILLLYKNSKNELILDQGYIFIGDIPENIHGYYTNFINWKINNGQENNDGQENNNHNHNNQNNQKLLCNNDIVDPKEVYLHIHVGDTIFESDYFTDNPEFYCHYFSSPTNKIYKSIRDQIIYSKIKIINMTDTCKLQSKLSFKERCDKIHDPRFFTYKRQIYGENMDHLMFTGLNIAML